MRLDRSAYKPIKRAFDLLIGGLLLALLAPLFLAIGLLICLDSEGPVFFRQQRAGRAGVPFRILKFRTMTDTPAFTRGAQAADDPRITRVGRWLRRASLDELPQLVNVLRGEVSLIGPRPALLHQIQRYDQRQRRRLDVRPGITGWAQVNGRNSLAWEEKIELDIWYVDHCSPLVDLRILFRTVRVLFSQSGIYFRGQGNAWHAPGRER